MSAAINATSEANHAAEKKKEHPSKQALSQLFAQIDDDEEWFPGTLTEDCGMGRR